MSYRQLSTVLVVLVVLLAGCSGGGMTDGAGDPSTETTDAPASGNGDSTAGDAGLSLSGADAKLRDAGSFTTNWTYTIEGTDGTMTLSDRYEVNLEANRSFERVSTGGMESGTDFEVFRADSTSYTRFNNGEQSFYQITDQTQSVFDSATGRASSFYGYLEEDAQRVGTETFDGVAVTRYEYSDAEAWQTYNQGVTSGAFDTDEEVTITDFEIATLVDADGVARLTTWTLVGETESGETVSAEWSYSLTDVGSTAVEDPDWLAEAQAQQG